MPCATIVYFWGYDMYKQINSESLIAIPPLNSSARAENSGRINAFSATGGADLKVNCYI